MPPGLCQENTKKIERRENGRTEYNVESLWSSSWTALIWLRDFVAQRHPASIGERGPPFFNERVPSPRTQYNQILSMKIKYKIAHFKLKIISVSNFVDMCSADKGIYTFIFR